MLILLHRINRRFQSSASGMGKPLHERPWKKLSQVLHTLITCSYLITPAHYLYITRRSCLNIRFLSNLLFPQSNWSADMKTHGSDHIPTCASIPFFTIIWTNRHLKGHNWVIVSARLVTLKKRYFNRFRIWNDTLHTTATQWLWRCALLTSPCHSPSCCEACSQKNTSKEFGILQRSLKTSPVGIQINSASSAEYGSVQEFTQEIR